MTVVLERKPGVPVNQVPDLPKIVYIDSSRKDSQRLTLANKLDGKLATDQIKAVEILQDLDIADIYPDNPLSMNEKAFLFFSYLWHEHHSLKPIKQFEDVREDFIDRMFAAFDDRISTAYDRFYSLYRKATEVSRQQGFINSLKDGLILQEAVDEYEISPDNPLLIDLSTKVDEKGQIAPEVIEEIYSNYVEQPKKTERKKRPQKIFIDEVKKGVPLSEAIQLSGITTDESQSLLLALLSKKHKDAREILLFKQNGLENTEIVERVKRPLKYVNNITRAFQFLEMIPSKFRTEQVEKQNEFMRRIMQLRSQNLGNIEISERLGVKLSKIEDATRFLVWVGLVDPINKSDALLKRHNKVDYKQQVRDVINSQDLSPSAPFVGLRRLYEESGLEIGFDKFSRLFHEIEKEPGQKVPRYKHKPFKTRLKVS